MGIQVIEEVYLVLEGDHANQLQLGSPEGCHSANNTMCSLILVRKIDVLKMVQPLPETSESHLYRLV